VRVFIVLLILAAGLASAAPAPPPPPAPTPAPVDFAHLPWADGESLTYLVSWENFQAAQGTFVTHLIGDHWEFDMTLASRGAVDTIYPFTANFWSILAPSRWRSVEYGEYRFEPKRVIRERTRVDYTTKQGTREMWGEGKTQTFPLAEDDIDDVGTMLYHVRAAAWKPGDKHTFYVYESKSEKQGAGECQARETRAFGTWPAQPVLRISLLPTVGTHKKGHLILWMTDDARHLPLHADLEFRYGTFELDLTSAVKTLPPGK